MKAVKKLMVVKFGGGLIAPKDLPDETADVAKIKQLIGELKKVWDEGFGLILLNGGGNYSHRWAHKFGTQNGFELDNKDLIWGAARTQFSIGLINKVVVQEGLEQGLPLVTVAPHDLWVNENGNAEMVEKVVNVGLIPVLHGDVIWDEQKGCVIYSGEQIIEKIVEYYSGKSLKIERIIQVGREKGVWDENKEIITEINSGNWEKYKNAITGSFGVDVTGGMLHKVETSMTIFRRFGVETYITNNLENYRSGTRIG